MDLTVVVQFCTTTVFVRHDAELYKDSLFHRHPRLLRRFAIKTVKRTATRRSAYISILVFALLAGCAAGPKYRPPATELQPLHNAAAIASRIPAAAALRLRDLAPYIRIPILHKLLMYTCRATGRWRSREWQCLHEWTAKVWKARATTRTCCR